MLFHTDRARFHQRGVLCPKSYLEVGGPRVYVHVQFVRSRSTVSAPNLCGRQFIMGHRALVGVHKQRESALTWAGLQGRWIAGEVRAGAVLSGQGCMLWLVIPT